MIRWIAGNHITLLENGEAFFPRVCACIAAAEREVVIETFILFEDKVGKQLHTALLQAAGLGAQVDITIDGFGSPDLSDDYIASLTSAGVRVHVFDNRPRFWGWRTNVFRRLHRKIVVVDGQRAFVGGINFSADHLADYGPAAKQDFSIEIEGPLVQVIHGFVHKALAAGQQNASGQPAKPWRDRFTSPPSSRLMRGALSSMPEPAGAAAIFVTRDNRKHTDDIERQYRLAIRSARQRVVIANAYFFPGYRLLADLRKAARRGVDVRLILQGEPDMPIVKTAASMLYHHLLKAGVKIYEYCERPLHRKVAVADDHWATVGSSNLDPLSLSLNLEANVIIRDRAFNAELSGRLDHLTQHSCKQIVVADLGTSGRWHAVRSFFLFHLLRRYPSWAGWLPAHAPLITPAVGKSVLSPARLTGADKVSSADPA